MTADNDLDRRLAEWLEDGPFQAPQGLADGAIQHARAHRRGRDPLAILRADPMAAPLMPAVVRPVLLVALLSLTLAALLASAAFLSRPTAPAVLPPGPTPSPSPTITIEPPGTVDFTVALLDEIGGGATVAVVDDSETVVAAGSTLRSLSTTEIPASGILVEEDPSAPNSIRLTWGDGPCDTRHVLAIDAGGRAMTLQQPVCQGDSLGVGRILILTYSQPIAAAQVQAVLVPVGSPAEQP